MGEHRIGLAGIAAVLLLALPAAASPFEEGKQGFAAGNFAAAIVSFRAAALEFEKAGKQAAHASALYNLALAQQAAGQFRLAYAAAGKALTAAEASGDARLLTRIRALAGSLAVFGRGGGDGAKALEDAMRAAEKDGDREALAVMANDYAVLLAARGEFDKATDQFDRSENLAGELGARELAAKVALNRALMHLGAARRYLDAEGGVSADWDPRGDETYQDHLRAAFADLATTSTRSRALPAAGFAKPLLLLGVGDGYQALARARTTFETGASEKAFSSYRAALAAAKSAGHRGALSQSLGRLGALYEQAGRLREALDLSRRARDLAAEIGAPDALFRWDWQVGRLLAARGDREGALAAYRRSVHVLGRIRHDVAIGHARAGHGRSFREAVGALYFELADLVLRSAELTDVEAEVQALYREARLVVEAYKSAELEDYFQDECVNLALASAQEVGEVEEGTAVFYVIPLERRSEVLVGIGGKIHRFASKLTGRELDNAARELRRGLESDGDPTFMAPAQQIFDTIVRPALPLLARERVNTLVFVPDGALRGVPMAALHDGKRYLVERFAVAVSPGLQLMEPKRVPREDVQMLIGALSEAVQGFPALPAVRGEVESIRTRISPPPTVMVDAQFLKDPFRKGVREQPYKIVHIASHGEFNSNSRDSFVLTYDGKIDLDELEAAIRPRKFVGEPVELLGLSACRTAAGDDRAALGLAGVAVKSGARSAFATLWYVDDAVSGALVSDFYRRLSEDQEISKAQALRLAQLEIMKDLRYAHPRAWAPYLIIGNWL